jgi:hypothetical protein
MDDSMKNTVALQLAQLLDQHFLRDRGDAPLELRKAHELAVKEVEQDHELPAPFQNLQHLFHTLGGGRRRMPPILTIR